MYQETLDLIIRRDVGGIVDEGLKAPKKQSACLIASQSERLLTEERSSGGKRRDADASNLRSPDTSVGMR